MYILLILSFSTNKTFRKLSNLLIFRSPYFFMPFLSKKVHIKDRHLIFLGTDIEMKVIVNENVANPIELVANDETSPGEELKLLEPLLANETSTDVEAIDPQRTEFQQEATQISLCPNIVVTTINEVEMTEITAKTEANYDTKGIYAISSQ